MKIIMMGWNGSGERMSDENIHGDEPKPRMMRCPTVNYNEDCYGCPIRESHPESQLCIDGHDVGCPKCVPVSSPSPVKICHETGDLCPHCEVVSPSPSPEREVIDVIDGVPVYLDEASEAYQVEHKPPSPEPCTNSDGTGHVCAADAECEDNDCADCDAAVDCPMCNGTGKKSSPPPSPSPRPRPTR